VLLDWFSNFLRLFLLGPVMLRKPAQMMKAMQGYWWLAVGVGLFSPLSYILVLTAVDMGAPLSLVAPAREMSMMIGAIFGMLILGEPVNIWRVAGCATIIAGVVLLGAA
jgi:uncharacterized membrane protein